MLRQLHQIRRVLNAGAPERATVADVGTERPHSSLGYQTPAGFAAAI
jgi:transposase InsO family protein